MKMCDNHQPERERANRKALLEALASFYRCPVTNQVIEAIRGDDKVCCPCGKTNPKIVAVGHREAPGVHIVSYLVKATADEYIQQEEARRG